MARSVQLGSDILPVCDWPSVWSS